jgi:4-hydroxybenzoate polyprenyltransferase
MRQKSLFVTGLFLLGLAGLYLGVSSKSWGWGLLGAACLAVGRLALRACKEEDEEQPPSGRFVVYSMLALVVGFGAIIWLSRR